MNTAAIHANDLLAQPFQRERLHATQAMNKVAQALFRGIPLVPWPQPALALPDLVRQEDLVARETTQGWFELVCAHALDFHDDAGRSGSRWDLACIDAFETWRMLCRMGQWQGGWVPEGIGLAVDQAPDEDEEALSMTWRRPRRMFNLGDWRRHLLTLGRARAAEDAALVAQHMPNGDIPSLALAVGALWAMESVGMVASISHLDAGGMDEGVILRLRWNSCPLKRAV